VTLGKELLCRVPEKNTRQRIWHSAKSQIPVVTGAQGTLDWMAMACMCCPYHTHLNLQPAAGN
jgi:hypothetical protein